VRKQFTGYERDEETELDFAQARYYAKSLGRFTTVDPLLASGRVVRPESWNRYVYCYNNPLVLIDPNGTDVKLLDQRSVERLLSTLPEELRKSVAKQIDKNGLLKKGALDKIKSENANFLDLKSMVNAKATVDLMTSDKDSKGTSFTYETIEEARKARYEDNIENGMSESEAKADADKLEFGKDRAQSMFGGETLSPEDNPAKNGHWLVIVPDGTGQTSQMPQSELAATTAHEFYGHAWLGVQGLPYKHEYSQPPGPVDSRTKMVENRTREMYTNKRK
jgi:RHS repeat-associated protein